MMTCFALAVLLIFKVFLVSAQTADDSCQDLLTEVTNCLAQESVSNVEEYTSLDEAACSGCLVSNTLISRSAEGSTCDSSIGEICNSFGSCSNSCFPSASVCQQEIYDYSVCRFGTALAPSGCVVQCDGSLPSGGDGLDVGNEPSEEESPANEDEESENDEESNNEDESENNEEGEGNNNGDGTDAENEGGSESDNLDSASSSFSPFVLLQVSLFVVLLTKTL